MFKKILVPLDHSKLAEQAVGQAAAIARASGAEMDLVLVHQLSPFDGYADAPWSVDFRQHERKYLARMAVEIESGASVPVRHAILDGDPIREICRQIGDLTADLVVMTSHGRTGLHRTWMGSVADGVLRHSAVPVLLLRSADTKREREAAHHQFKHILVPIDGSLLSMDAIGPAIDLARCSNARISLLCVVLPIPIVSAEPGFAYIPPLVDEVTTNRLADEARTELATLCAHLRDEYAVPVDANIVVHPFIAPAILDFARSHDVDVIAMSTHGRGLSRFFMGSVAEKLLRGSTLPMLIYRPDGARTPRSEYARLHHATGTAV